MENGIGIIDRSKVEQECSAFFPVIFMLIIEYFLE